jgi:hypothetical protein
LFYIYFSKFFKEKIYFFIELLFFRQAKLQIGGTGERICQAKNIKLVTSCIIPIQIDGEPLKLNPSIIEIKHKNQSLMLERVKSNNYKKYFYYYFYKLNVFILFCFVLVLNNDALKLNVYNLKIIKCGGKKN